MVNYMWILYSLLAALFSSLTTIFGKVGLSKNNSTFVTGLRTVIITIFTIIVYCLFKTNLDNINFKAIIYIFLSAITTALLWLSYFKALSLAPVSLVTPIDKLSIILTLVLSNLFLKEKITIIKIISMLLIIIGTFLIVKKRKENKNNSWLIYAFLTALFASLSTIFGKIGVKDIDSNFIIMLRTIIVLIIIWIIIILKKEYKNINLTRKNIVFIILSGISTGFSWLFYFKALKIGEASIVFSIEKLSAGIAIILSIIFLREHLNKRGILGLIMILFGTILLMIKIS